MSDRQAAAVEALAAEAFERLLPPESPSFFDGMWQQVEILERRSARRWRRASIVLAAVALVTATAAAVFAAGGLPDASGGAARVIDRTLVCKTSHAGIYWKVTLRGSVRFPSHPLADLTLDTAFKVDPKTNFLIHQVQIASTTDGFTTDGSACTQSAASGIPLAAGKLPSNGVVTPHFVGQIVADCKVEPRIRVHVRVTTRGSTPVAAEMAIRNYKSNQPVAFLSWSTERLASYFSSRCYPN
jgi:hypothetical protein